MACAPGELRDRHAATVDAYQRTPLLPADSAAADPVRALGPPDGRTVAIGSGGWVVLRFFREIPDGPGPDLRIYEVGADGAQATVAVGIDGIQFVRLPDPAGGQTTGVDLAGTGFVSIGYVRLEGLDELGLEPGFDLDALEALH